MKKKLLCLVLSLAMMAVFMPSMAFAAETVQKNVSNHTQLVNALEEENVQVINITNSFSVDETILIKGMGSEDEPLYINLQNHTLNGDGHQIFSIHRSYVVLENGTLTGGFCNETRTDYGRGGAIYLNRDADLTLKNMTVTGNRTDVEGGAIDLNGDLNLEGKVFVAGNTAGGDAHKSDIYVHGGADITVVSLSKGSKVGLDVTEHKDDHLIINLLPQKYVAYFFADNPDLDVAYAYKAGNKTNVELYVDEAREAAIAVAEAELGKAAAGYDTGKIKEIYDAAILDINAVDSTPQVIKAVAANALQKIAALKTTSAVAKGAFVGGILVSQAAEKMYNDAKHAVGEVNSRVQAAVREVAGDVREAAGRVMDAAYGVTMGTVTVVSGIIENTYGKLVEEVTTYAEGSYSEAVKTLAANALLEVEKPYGNLVTKTFVLKTALQQINVAILAEDTAVVAGKATVGVLAGVYHFLGNLFHK